MNSLPVTLTRSISLQYLIYTPDAMQETPAHRWPLMLFLHGAGERGSDLEKLKIHGPTRLAEEGREFPFILIAPQCPENSWWTHHVIDLVRLLDDVQGKYAIDPRRIYVTGLSMGGYGTWELITYHPERFAAAAPICGGASLYLRAPWAAMRLKEEQHGLLQLPVWAFHGQNDSIVPLDESISPINTLRAAGAPAKLTIYPETDHDSWIQAYNNPELWTWFLSHAR